MDYKIYTQDGVVWSISGVEPDDLQAKLNNPNARFITMGDSIMEQKGNIAMVAPDIAEGETENLFDVYLNIGQTVTVQSTDDLINVTQQLNAARSEFVRFGDALVNPNAPRRITKHGAIKQQ